MIKQYGIIGVGMVGGALKNYFEKKEIKPFLYDKGKNLGSIEEVNRADVIFICVPTPFDKDLPAPRPNTFYIYVIACEDGSYYIGYTENLRSRWLQHKEGKGANWTKKNKPLYITHYEEFSSQKEAITREKWLKTGFGRKWLKRQIKTGRARQAGKGFDLSFIEDACRNISGEKIVIIKSTVLPGTTEKLQKKYPQHKFLFNPEFLSETTADFDFQNPDRQLIGYTQKSKDVAKIILDLLPRAPFEKILLASEAEMVKYFNNTFNAVKVIFANQIYDLCHKLDLNYDNIMDCAAASRFIQIEDHLHAWHKDYRGYGGKCLPKDIRALIQFANENDVDLKLHKTVEKINNELMKQQGIGDPEKFSKRN